MTEQNIPEEDLSCFCISKGCDLAYTYVEITICCWLIVEVTKRNDEWHSQLH